MDGDGVRVGDYTLLEALDGHEREVHTARDASGIQAIVAMFEVTDEGAKGIREDYERAKALEHEAIASALDLFETDGKIAMVFQGIAGVSTSQVLDYLDARFEHLSDGAALKIGLSLCEALHAAHTAKDASGKVAPLVHAQLGPHQVFLTFDGKVRLLGLGLGTAFRTAAGRGEIPAEAEPYQAPEVLRGGPLTVRANIYSAGAVLWRLLSRKPLPSKGKSFPPLSGIRTDLPAMLTKAVDAALEPSMLKRRTTCVQLARAIARTGLADAKDLRWNLEILEEQVEFANSTIGALSFPPAKLSDVAPESIQPVSSSFPAPDSDAPTNVVAVPRLAPPPAFEASTTAGPSPEMPARPSAPSYLDVVPMPAETPEMAEVRERIAAAARGKRPERRITPSTPDVEPETDPRPATSRDEQAAGPPSEDVPTLRPSVLMRQAVGAGDPSQATKATIEAVAESSRPANAAMAPTGMILTPARWVGSVIAVAGLCGLFLVIGILIGRSTVVTADQPAPSHDIDAPPPPAPTPSIPPAPTPTAAAEPAPASTATPAPAEERLGEDELPPLGQGQGHLFVKTRQPSAQVYVAGRASGPPGQVLVVPCGVRNVRIGTLPLTRWLSPSRAFNLVCGSKTTLWLETNRAVQVKDVP